MSRKIIFLTMPIEALLDVLAGRATATLPSDIPPDSTLLYSFVDHEAQVLKMALSHPTLTDVSESGYIKHHKLVITPIAKKEEAAEGYSAEKLVGSDMWDRIT